jgi:hypothetical protein
MDERTKRHLANAALAGAVVAAGLIVWAAVRQWPAPAPAPVASVEAPVAPPTPSPSPAAPVIPRPTVAPQVVVTPDPPIVAPRVGPVARPTPAPIPQPRAELPVAEPDARVALAGVGKDPSAERVWVAAINDTTNLSPRDRKNLIEDLNETGFADPRNLTLDDLPVINNRIALIESLYQDAADATNAAAFDEAYKDLLAMRARLTGP